MFIKKLKINFRLWITRRRELRKYKKKIEEDEDIVKSIQDGNKTE